MHSSEMRIANPENTPVASETDILSELLPLKGAKVLELGCGKAEKTRFVSQNAASVLALEVDKVQLAKNQAIHDLPNVRFEYGGAENIPAANASFDIVLMFKSLHHVPVDQMDTAFSEIRRVLKPGGIIYISEPVYAGDLNEIIRLFNNEKIVREAAFEAEKKAVLSGRLKLLQQQFFLQPVVFENFDQFAEQAINVTHANHRLSPEILREVRSKFEQHMTEEGAHFVMPMRVDLLQA